MSDNIARVLCRIRRDKSGVAAVEFALASTVLMLMLMGAIDLGLAVRHGNQIEAAIRNGLQFALIQGTKLQPFITVGAVTGYETQVESIVQNTPGLPAAANVNAQLECRCVTVTGGVVTEGTTVGTKNTGTLTGNCGASFCTSPQVMYHFVKITVTQTHNMMVDWPGIPNPITMTMTKDVKVPVNE